ncbi:MAG: type II toxin-antitoxin system VapC family toxin [Bosea sp. (in: a-proteobacteria)]
MSDLVVVDASVAMKWFVDEDDSDRAETLLAADIAIAPAIILSEVGNGIWTKRRSAGIDGASASRFIGHLTQLLREVVPLDTLMAEAMKLAFDLDHPVYDCVYLALARSRGSVLVTADKRFIDKLSGQDHPVALLADWTP